MLEKVDEEHGKAWRISVLSKYSINSPFIPGKYSRNLNLHVPFMSKIYIYIATIVLILCNMIISKAQWKILEYPHNQNQCKCYPSVKCHIMHKHQSVQRNCRILNK